jgi:hypothetical protein
MAAAAAADGAGRQLAEGLLDWQQLQLILEVRRARDRVYGPHARQCAHVACTAPLHESSETRACPCACPSAVPEFASQAATRPSPHCNAHYPDPCSPRQTGGWAPAGVAALQAGPAGCLLPARYEPHDTLVVQLEGARRVLLVPPEMVGACGGLWRLFVGGAGKGRTLCGLMGQDVSAPTGWEQDCTAPCRRQMFATAAAARWAAEPTIYTAAAHITPSSPLQTVSAAGLPRRGALPRGAPI